MMKGPFGEEIIFKKRGLKTLLKKKDHYFFVDKVLKRNVDFTGCKNILFLKAGEGLKTTKSWNQNIAWLLKHKVSKSSTVVAVGGGSIGDSVGFLASTYLRGVDLVHVPTTWLAAVDSSVGGKTALNCRGYKNQVGTVYAPKRIYYFSEFLKTSKIKDSEGEILKTLILNNNKVWAKTLLKTWAKNKITFANLPQFVSYKTKIIKKDPWDVKGVRAVLNLGHTVGHALEPIFRLSHSDAVKKGLLFSIRWSVHKKLLTTKNGKDYEKALSETLPSVSTDKLNGFISKDKKSLGDNVNFIFVTNRGSLVREVKIKDLLVEYQRQLKYEL